MASIRQIAKRLGVSPATVSRAMNNHASIAPDLRKKIMGAINRTRYVPRVGRRSTTNIAFVYTAEPSLDSPFDSALLGGMGTRMEEYGFDLMILSTRTAKLPDETFSQMFLRKGIRGAVLRTTAEARTVCEEIIEEEFPAVVVGDRFDDPRASFIYSESRSTSREAIEYLVHLGHRRIAISVSVVDDSDHADRLAGYQEAIAANNIPFEEQLVFRTLAKIDGGAQVMRRLMSLPNRPTALYCADPMTAVGAINEARSLGVAVPQDLSIVGFDDADLRFMVHPTMTCVCQDTLAIGREAFDVLHGMISSTEALPAVHRVLPTRFEVHGSTAAVKR